MNNPTSPTSLQEKELWTNILEELQLISNSRDTTDGLTGRINKVHSKISSLSATGGFTTNSAIKLRDLYKNTFDALQKESSMMEKTLEKIKILMTGQEQKDQELKKRKAEELVRNGNNAKRAKLDDDIASSLYIGTQVAAKVDNDWILAFVFNPNVVKGKIEVEDVEDDEEHPGVKKRYVVSIKFIIPIVKDIVRKEFPKDHKVLALYPASSCFYKATVVLPPSMNGSPDNPGNYVVQFDDDNGFERQVSPAMIIAFP